MQDRTSFYVLKQVDGRGPIYKLKVSTKSLEILDKEVITEIPEGWSTQDFYDLLDEGNRLEIKID